MESTRRISALIACQGPGRSSTTSGPAWPRKSDSAREDERFHQPNHKLLPLESLVADPSAPLVLSGLSTSLPYDCEAGNASIGIAKLIDNSWPLAR